MRCQACHQEHDKNEIAQRVCHGHGDLREPAARMQQRLEPENPGESAHGHAGDGTVEAHTGVDASKRRLRQDDHSGDERRVGQQIENVAGCWVGNRIEVLVVLYPLGVRCTTKVDTP